MFCDILKKFLASKNVDGRDPTDMRDDQKEHIFPIIRVPIFVEGDLQGRRF